MEKNNGGRSDIGHPCVSFPPALWRRLGAINSLLNGDPSSIVDGSIFYGDRGDVAFIIVYIGLIILLKGFATSATNGAGGVGGTFAPSLYVGCMTMVSFCLPP